MKWQVSMVMLLTFSVSYMCAAGQSKSTPNKKAANTSHAISPKVAHYVPLCRLHNNPLDISNLKLYNLPLNDSYSIGEELRFSGYTDEYIVKGTLMYDLDYGDGDKRSVNADDNNIFFDHVMLHSYKNKGPVLLHLVGNNNGSKVCEFYKVLVINTPVPPTFSQSIQNASRKFIDMVGDNYGQGMGKLSGSKEYPLKIQINDSLAKTKDETTCRAVGDLHLSPAEGCNGCLIGSSPLRITSGSLVCSNVTETTDYKMSVRFVSGTIIDSGAVGYEKGSKVDIDGTSVEYDGLVWKSESGKDFPEKQHQLWEQENLLDQNQISQLISQIDHSPSLQVMAIGSTISSIKNAVIEKLNADKKRADGPRVAHP
jgi:hypothetical protein